MSNVIDFQARLQPNTQTEVDHVDELAKIIMLNFFETAKEYSNPVNSAEHTNELVLVFESIRSALLAGEGKSHVLQTVAQQVFDISET